MKNPGLWLQIRMETPESLPEVILDGERITLIQCLELIVEGGKPEVKFDEIKFRLRHYETAQERGTQSGGVTEIYMDSMINAPRYKDSKPEGTK